MGQRMHSDYEHQILLEHALRTLKMHQIKKLSPRVSMLGIVPVLTADSEKGGR